MALPSKAEPHLLRWPAPQCTRSTLAAGRGVAGAAACGPRTGWERVCPPKCV